MASVEENISRQRIELRSVGELNPYSRNARTHSDEQVAQIAASIVEFGWTNPILVDAEGVVVAGHGRLLAARRLGIDTVPVVVLGHLTPAQRRAYVIADNKLALNAGWNEELLAADLRVLIDDGFDLALTGFDEAELERLMAPLDEAGGDGAALRGSLADRFGVPPFSVLNAREGWWQDRKRAWLALGIMSELGRGAPIGGAAMPIDGAKATSAPGGSALPAANYSKNRARGDGRGRPAR